MRPDYSLGNLNTSLLLSNVLIWGIIWLCMVAEKLKYGKVSHITFSSYVELRCLKFHDQYVTKGIM